MARHSRWRGLPLAALQSVLGLALVAVFLFALRWRFRRE
jgi:hypothetical protein